MGDLPLGPGGVRPPVAPAARARRADTRHGHADGGRANGVRRAAVTNGRGWRIPFKPRLVARPLRRLRRSRTFRPAGDTGGRSVKTRDGRRPWAPGARRKPTERPDGELRTAGGRGRKSHAPHTSSIQANRSRPLPGPRRSAQDSVRQERHGAPPAIRVTEECSTMKQKWALRAVTLTLGAGAVLGLSVGSANAASTLRVGSSGSAVTCLQQGLNYVDAAGLDTDGQFGQLTKGAVVDYQSGHSLDPDGVVGPATGGSIKTSVRQAYDNAHHVGDWATQNALGAWMNNCNWQLPG
ncbi:hypothetical protein C2142_29790 [Streptomyces sp. CB01881]|nr:hypothetical protein C2142_29790 [Streptomyces sp. CB01881]